MANARFGPFIKSNDCEKIIKWFENIFKITMREEGWFIARYRYLDDIGYGVLPAINGISYPKLTSKEAAIIAREYGWKVDKDNFIIDFKIKKLKRNKHLLTCTELGLI